VICKTKSQMEDPFSLIQYYEDIKNYEITRADIRYYEFTDDIKENTLMLLERLKYDEFIESFDTDIESRKIDWSEVIISLLLKENPNGVELNYIGYYYNCIEKNHDLIIKYYNRAIENGYIQSASNLALYYKSLKMYDEMKKYFLIGVVKNDVYSMNQLGIHYQLVEKDYEQMKLYYIMAIDKDCVESMINIGCYYRDIEKDFDKMFEFFAKAIQLDYKLAYDQLVLFLTNYETDQKVRGDIINKFENTFSNDQLVEIIKVLCYY